MIPAAAIPAAIELLPLLKGLMDKIGGMVSSEAEKSDPGAIVALTGQSGTASVGQTVSRPITALQAIEILALFMPKDDKDKEDYIAAVNMVLKGISIMQKVGLPVAVPQDRLFSLQS